MKIVKSHIKVKIKMDVAKEMRTFPVHAAQVPFVLYAERTLVDGSSRRGVRGSERSVVSLLTSEALGEHLREQVVQLSPFFQDRVRRAQEGGHLAVPRLHIDCDLFGVSGQLLFVKYFPPEVFSFALVFHCIYEYFVKAS